MALMDALEVDSASFAEWVMAVQATVPTANEIRVRVNLGQYEEQT